MTLRGAEMTVTRIARWCCGVLNALLIAYIVLVAGAVLYHHPVRFDLTAKAVRTLSDDTRNCLRSLKEPVRVIVAFGEADPVKRMVAGRVFQEAQDCLREYTLASAKIQVIDVINVYQRQEAWQQARERFKLTDANRVTFMAGARQLDVRLEDMASVKYGRPGSPPMLESMHIERAFTAALRRLQGEPCKAYLLVNEGIRGQRGPDPGNPGPGGLSAFVAELKANNYDVRLLDLAREGKVPADCEVLLAVGLLGPLPSELRAVEAYLEGGGKFFLALNWQYSYHGLAFLEDWGVAVLPAWVVMEHQIAGTKIQTEHVLVTEFDELHPIMRRFEKGRFRMQMTYARPLGGARGLHGESVPIVGVNAANIWGERKAGTADRPWVCEAGDFPSAPDGLSVGRALECRTERGAVTRIAVFGTWTFLGNERLYEFDHASVLHNTLWWLIGREEQAGVRDPEVVIRNIGFDPEGKVRGTLAWALLAIVPGCAALAGVIILFARRK
ncbi:MAG TPA: GldG family protein [Planctomycetota bacterium]|nr:GldG family protein [Planctomycetota bacterium]NMD35401.1 GldG family protein [Planctomycetota bacterium]HNR98658.1 GldG family protein [Planctomycetota bacterium]HNU25038.1 GldG family protein [Planctomycetota bacterium]HOE28478.1 GldG family protein [Planctomycetota bacterium]